ncbi:iron complex transport system ATP-binding protein [Marininema mesophilum]|uniref:Iron complex transport system ATP-binding protein n=1 Tax=Marininema mesophilum TaxID=1048340 RepID=A0A1H2Z139_9BACL|nr:ABC transporter ATP-binding protein [Marininema mesophilum]SDX10718.1 iron complex transport system ATP-binding protein [Marininema mesophilum]
MLKAKALKKAYQGQAVLHGVDLEIKRGEILGLLGPNGSGKTTLVRLLCGEEPPDEGVVSVEGRALDECSPRSRAKKMAVLPQEGLPNVPFTVEEVVMMGRHPHQGIWPWTGYGDRRTVERVLTDTHLLEDRRRPVGLLSGGERQRVAIAKAMAQEPELLFLDEPTTYLDIAHQIAVLDHIKRWQRECGLAVLVVFHDLNLAAQYCDRLAIMKEGAILHTGTPKEVIKGSIIHEVYGVEPLIIHHPVSHVPQVILQSGESPQGELSATVMSM